LISAPGCSLCAGGVSPVPLIPQDKEGFGSFKSHEENVMFIFEESRTLRSNQQINEVFTKTIQKQQSFRKSYRKKHQAINYA
jgi:hypothetical protein